MISNGWTERIKELEEENEHLKAVLDDIAKCMKRGDDLILREGFRRITYTKKRR